MNVLSGLYWIYLHLNLDFISIFIKTVVYYDLTLDGTNRIIQNNSPEKEIYDWIESGKTKKEVTGKYKGLVWIMKI